PRIRTLRWLPSLDDRDRAPVGIQHHGWLLHPDLAPLVHHVKPVFLTFVAGVVFAESGLLVGFPSPGDSFLFAAGLVAGLYGGPNRILLMIVAWAAAVSGDQVGYRIGIPALRRPRSRL